ncbi:MAG TPA: CFI-box-CTERM domain-containing protein [Candidatus Nitrosotenuis sp.]|nr:CFI-box-CTERM domain-containing protein [Candidatus Nitrosotenuis sp.]
MPDTYGTLQAAQNTITTPPVPFISVSTKSMSFGNTAVSDKSTKSVTVTNTGTGLLKISNVWSSGEFSSSGIIFPAEVQPGGSVTFDIVFSPLTIGSKTGTVTISSNDLSNSSYAISVDGKAVEKGVSPIPTGKGCLIATAAFGSELSPQVQLLREVRDNVLLSTSSGTWFIDTFNAVYYSFSPTVADWERDSPVFKEAVKIVITPMILTLSILNHVHIDSEQEMLGYGIGIILLNVGMYFVVPVVVIMKIRSKLF